MPRNKTINLTQIGLNKIIQEEYLDIVEEKDCFSVGLTFNTPFTSEQWNIIKKRFYFTINKNACTVYRKINNSWKGLIMALLSLAYCKHGDKIVERFWGERNTPRNKNKRKKKNKKPSDGKDGPTLKIGKHMLIDYNYGQLLDEKTKSKIKAEFARQSTVTGQDNIEKMILAYFFGPRDVLERNIREHDKEVLTEIFANLPEDDRIEEVFGPEDWRSLYVKASYEARDIQEYLVLLGDMLDLDLAKSYVGTDYSKELPHKYHATAATPKYCGLPFG